METDKKASLRYAVRLLIKHPGIDPQFISKELGLTPIACWSAGAARATPTGRPLPGVHKESMWNYSNKIEGDRRFFEHFAKMISDLEPQARFLAEIVEGGGTVTLIIHLPGDINIGNVLSWRYLERLSRLHVDLGIEVFPQFA